MNRQDDEYKQDDEYRQDKRKTQRRQADRDMQEEREDMQNDTIGNALMSDQGDGWERIYDLGAALAVDEFVKLGKLELHPNELNDGRARTFRRVKL